MYFFKRGGLGEEINVSIKGSKSNKEETVMESSPEQLLKGGHKRNEESRGRVLGGTRSPR